jgi:hypothetical protein
LTLLLALVIAFLGFNDDPGANEKAGLHPMAVHRKIDSNSKLDMPSCGLYSHEEKKNASRGIALCNRCTAWHFKTQELVQ